MRLTQKMNSTELLPIGYTIILTVLNVNNVTKGENDKTRTKIFKNNGYDL